MKENVSLIDSIRKRPGMYLGDPTTQSGLFGVVKELLANVIDLHLRGDASMVSISQNSEQWITVKDNGPGLPYDDIDEQTGFVLADKHFTVGHDTPTADGHSPHIHLSSIGVGLILVNAVSKQVKVISVRNGIEYQQMYTDQKAEKISSRPTDDSSGTEICFLLNPDIFTESIVLEWALCRTQLFSIAHLYPGLLVEFENERFYSRNGLEDYVNLLVAHDNWHDNKGAVALLDSKEMPSGGFCQINFACGGQRSNNQGMMVKSWANGVFCPDGGTHVTGMKRALTRAGLTPSIAMLSLVLDSPRFGSPTKSKLVNKEIEAHVYRQLTNYFKTLVSG